MWFSKDAQQCSLASKRTFLDFERGNLLLRILILLLICNLAYFPPPLIRLKWEGITDEKNDRTVSSPTPKYLIVIHQCICEVFIKTGQIYFSFVLNCLCPFKSALYPQHWAFSYLPDSDEVLCSNKRAKILSQCIFCAICEVIVIRRDRQTRNRPGVHISSMFGKLLKPVQVGGDQ